MSRELREGDRVEVRGMGRRRRYAGEVVGVDGEVAQVLQDGKVKAKPVSLDKLRLLERRPPPPAKLTRQPDTRPKPGRPQPRPRPPASDDGYLDFIRSQPCAWCGKRGCTEPHHWDSKRGTAQKVSDYFTVPLCGPAGCHEAWHRNGELPGLTPEQSRELFRDSQRTLMERALRLLRAELAKLRTEVRMLRAELAKARRTAS